MIDTLNIEDKANSFSYITFKMQASMHEADAIFYGLENTTKRILSCLLACSSGRNELLVSAKKGMIGGFNKLKNEENLPILCYDTIDSLMKSIDNKL